jgi:hypothetical protein
LLKFCSLGAHAKDLDTQGEKIGIVIPKATRLRRAAPSARYFVPANRSRFVRSTGAWVEKKNGGLLR